jgi:glycerol-3-phosphate acyltransferase PlsX
MPDLRDIRQAPRSGRISVTRVALDLMGGDGAPEVVADAVGRISSDVDLVLVGPEATARSLLAERQLSVSRLVPADGAVAMGEEPLAALRDRPDASVLIAAQLVKDGDVDAWVSVGHSGAAVAAAALVLGRIDGMTRPAIAVVLPSLAGPVILLDAGAGVEASPDTLLQFALAGRSYADALDIAEPRIGLLSIGTESGKGDPLRRVSHELLSTTLPTVGVSYAGLVEGSEAATGRQANVIVTDGFTGNVLLKGIEGAVAWSAIRMGHAYADEHPAHQVLHDTAVGDFAGGMVLGVHGVTVVGHGAASAEQIAACVHLAARAAQHNLVTRTTELFAQFQAKRRGEPKVTS